MMNSRIRSKRMIWSLTLLVALAVVGSITSMAFTSDRRDLSPQPNALTTAGSTPASRGSQKAEAASGTACGDVNANGSITSSDVIGLVNYVFKSGAAPSCPSCVIADGTVSPIGTVVNAGTGNWTVSWNAVQSWYELAITGEDYFFADYHTSLTIQGVGSGVASSAISSTNSLAVIQFYNAAGVPVQSYFTFTTTKF